MVGWTVSVLVLMKINWNWGKNQIIELARVEARTSIEKDLVYSQWNASHGGVYVPVSEGTQPNAYLEVTDRDITTPSGSSLTLMNPADMTHQVYKNQAEGGIQFHLTSSKPIDPNNTADAWEINALNEFENGAEEISSVEMMDGAEYLRLIRPFKTETGCLKCHGSQDSRTGEVQGGLSVSIPLKRYAEINRSMATKFLLLDGIFWLAGLMGIAALTRKTNRDGHNRLTTGGQHRTSVRESESRLRDISDSLIDLALYVYVIDKNNRPRFDYVSAGMEFLIGVSSEEAINNAANFWDVILPEYRTQFAEMERISRENLTHFEMEVRLQHAHTGKIRWLLIRSTPYRKLDGSTYWYGVLVDITARKQNEVALEKANELLQSQMDEIELLQEKLREQALRDPLTGMYNRYFLNESLPREVARADRKQNSLSIIISDIDHFKRINDTYGHQVGDEFLAKLANLIVSNSRSSDIICRYGGEEFLLVLPGTTARIARKRANQLRVKCEAMFIPCNGRDLNVTLSFGVATYPVHGREAEEIVIKADKALYKSKRRGRNCVTVWSREMDGKKSRPGKVAARVKKKYERKLGG